jgi:hypothetical protein
MTDHVRGMRRSTCKVIADRQRRARSLLTVSAAAAQQLRCLLVQVLLTHSTTQSSITSFHVSIHP